MINTLPKKNKMKNRLLILTLLICMPFLTMAQAMDEFVEVKWADLEYGAPKSKNMFLLEAYKIDGEYILLRKEPIKGPGGYLYFVERYDEDFNRMKSINISSMVEQKGLYIKDIRKVKDALLIVTSEIDKGTKTISTYGQLISFPSLEKGEQVLMYSGKYKKRNGISVKIKQSQDENNLMVVIYPPYDKGEKERVQYNVYSSSLELLFERSEVELRETDRDFRVDETIITNEAQVLIMGTVLPKKGEDYMYYKIYRITEDNEEFYVFDEEIKGINIISPTMFQTKTGNLVGGGYYTGETSVNKGAFLFRFDVESMKVTEFVHHEFTDDFIKEGFSERSQKKMDKQKAKGKEIGIHDLILKDIIPTADGGFYMVGAVQYIYSTTYTDSNGNTRTRTYYVHNDIVVSKVSSEKEFLWTEKIRKRENVARTEYGTHYSYILEENNLYLFFRDYKSNFIYENSGQDIAPKSKKLKDPVFGVTLVSEEGRIQRSAVIDYSDETIEDYRAYHLANDVYSVGDHSEVIAITYFGKKRFGIAKMVILE